MGRPHDAEVATVEGRDGRRVQALGGRDDRGVDAPERKVAIGGDELCDSEKIGRIDGLEEKLPGGQVAEQANLRLDRCGSQPVEKVRDLGKAERREDQGTGVLIQQRDALDVVRVIGIEIRVERAGVDYERDRGPTSAARISSMRSEMSRRPLRTAPEADSLRRRSPTNRASRASRVTSLIVEPRRRAS